MQINRAININRRISKSDNLYRSKLSEGTRLKQQIRVTNPQHHLFGLIGYITNYNPASANIFIPITSDSGHKVEIKWDNYSVI